MALIDFTVSHRFAAPSRVVWDELAPIVNTLSALGFSLGMRRLATIVDA